MALEFEFEPTKQGLINRIIGVVNANHPDLVKPSIQECLASSFSTSAVRYAIFVEADIELVISILKFIIRYEPASVHVVALQEAIKSAAAYNKLDILEYIISTYPEVNIHFDEDYPLRVACQNGWRDIVQFLLNRGANPNIGKPTAIEAARDQENILELLNLPIERQNLL